MSGDFAEAEDEPVMDTSDAHQIQITQHLNNPQLQAQLQQLVMDMLHAKRAGKPGAYFNVDNH